MSENSSGQKEQKHQIIISKIVSLEATINRLEHFVREVQGNIQPATNPKVPVNKSLLTIMPLSEFLSQAPDRIIKMDVSLSEILSSLKESLF